MKRTILAIALAPTAALAAEPGIQNHDIQVLFADAPCTRIIEMIDDPAPAPESIGMMAMAFGFLMGFEVENPGIRGNSQTILTRLREDCAAEGERSALTMLRGYAAELD